MPGNIYIEASRGTTVSTGSTISFFNYTWSSGHSISSRNGYITIGKNNKTYTFLGNNVKIHGDRWFVDNREVTPLDSEEIKRYIPTLHSRLLALTSQYLSKKDITLNKRHLFQTLKNTLDNSGGGTFYQRIVAFKDALESADQQLISQHRTDTWLRYFYNAISLLTIIPALVRAKNSYTQYGTLQFWKPDSLQVAGSCQAATNLFDYSAEESRASNSNSL
ncbi:hypothetical protein ACFORL_04775 [Legionella dresdenensis]|uniref:Uncharacterized protein n=1 Tax=Legionella dresdenensis TaxID=450200 RepID=A0ABV8CDJ3_9GAMM